MRRSRNVPTDRHLQGFRETARDLRVIPREHRALAVAFSPKREASRPGAGPEAFVLFSAS